MKEAMILLLVVFLMAPLEISSVSITVSGENGIRFGFNDSVVGFTTQTGMGHSVSYTIDSILTSLYSPPPFKVETFIGIDLITNVSQPLLATQIVNTSTGAMITFDYRPNAQRDGVEFTMRVVHDRPGVGGDCTRQIQAIIQLDSTVVNGSTTSNGNYTEVTLTVYTAAGYVVSYSQPLVATYSDTQSTGSGFGWSDGPSNTSIVLSISASWNATWVYDPVLSVLVDGKQGDGDGYDTTLMALLIPSVVVPFAISCSAFIILLTIFTVYMRNRRIATRDRVNFA